MNVRRPVAQRASSGGTTSRAVVVASLVVMTDWGLKARWQAGTREQEGDGKHGRASVEFSIAVEGTSGVRSSSFPTDGVTDSTRHVS